jgi:hypothetical protein
MVIFDHNYNPAWNRQAVNRIYRFGQTKDVFVYRFEVKNCDDAILRRQIMKETLAKKMLFLLKEIHLILLLLMKNYLMKTIMIMMMKILRKALMMMSTILLGNWKILLILNLWKTHHI